MNDVVTGARELMLSPGSPWVVVCMALVAACGDTKDAGSNAAAGGSGGTASGSGGARVASGGSGASTASGGSAGSANGVPPDRFGEEVSEARCAQLARCDPAGRERLDRSPDGCSGLYLRYAGEPFELTLLGEIDAGVVSYDPAAVAECLQRVAEEVCEEETPDIGDANVCEGAIDGTLELGEECLADVQCRGDAHCDRDATCPGLCTQRGESAAPCLSDDDCKRGLYCDTSASAEFPRCVPLGKQGEPCDPRLAYCENGLGCVSEDDVTGTCDVPLIVEIGAVCDNYSRLCAADAVCGIAAVTPAGAFEVECQRLSVSGGACSGYPGTDGTCPKGEYCPVGIEDVQAGNLESVCVPVGGLGASCQAVFSLIGCTTFHCDMVTNTCTLQGGLGASCIVDEDCALELCVDGSCSAPELECQP